jgi:LysW-gamma-L-lysine carboxypeptidase
MVCNTADPWWQQSRLRLSFRLPPSLTPLELKAQLRNLAAPDLDLAFTPALPAYRGEKNTALTWAFLASIRSQGGKPSFKVKSGTADMNIVGPAWNVPILAYGPGDSALDHTPFEHISLVEYSKSIAILSQVILRLPGTEPYRY